MRDVKWSGLIHTAENSAGVIFPCAFAADWAIFAVLAVGIL